MKELSFEIKIPQIKLSGDRRRQARVLISVLMAVAVFFAQQNFDFTVGGTLILLYLGLSLLWNLDSRFAAGAALFFLACCPFLLILENEPLAETSAIYAYYFLVITVMGELIALKQDKKRNLTD